MGGNPKCPRCSGCGIHGAQDHTGTNGPSTREQCGRKEGLVGWENRGRAGGRQRRHLDVRRPTTGAVVLGAAKGPVGRRLRGRGRRNDCQRTGGNGRMSAFWGNSPRRREGRGEDVDAGMHPGVQGNRWAPGSVKPGQIPDTSRGLQSSWDRSVSGGRQVPSLLPALVSLFME